MSRDTRVSPALLSFLGVVFFAGVVVRLVLQAEAVPLDPTSGLPLLHSPPDRYEIFDSHGSFQSEHWNDNRGTASRFRHRLDESFASALEALRTLYRAEEEAFRAGPCSRGAFFRYENALGLVGVRMLASAYPYRAIGPLSDLAIPPQNNRDDRRLAVHGLRELALRGSVPAQMALKTVAEQLKGCPGRDETITDPPEEIVAMWALEALTQSDRKGVYRDLYREKAALGDCFAVEALSYWPDPRSEEVLRERIKASEESDSSCLYQAANAAQDSLKRLQLLKSGNWRSVGMILLGHWEEILEDHSFPWAVRVARDAGYPLLTALTRERLDRVRRRQVNDLWVSSPRHARRNGRCYSCRYLAGHPHDCHFRERDVFYYEVLVAHYKAGGQVSFQERMTLEKYGFTGNVKRQLARVIARRW